MCDQVAGRAGQGDAEERDPTRWVMGAMPLGLQLGFGSGKKPPLRLGDLRLVTGDHFHCSDSLHAALGRGALGPGHVW